MRARFPSIATFGGPGTLMLLAAVAVAEVQPRRTITTLKISPEVLGRAVKPQAEAGRAQADQARSKNGYGPGGEVDLADVVRVEQLDRFGLDLRELCRLSLVVYRDANPDSGIYYYRPRRYALRFDPADGYYLSMDYKAAAESGSSVLIQARLTPGAGAADLDVLRALLRRHLGAGAAEPTLLRLPATYEARFDLSAFGVDTVTISGIDPDSGELVISFTTGVETKELLTSTLGNVNGLMGYVTVKPTNVSDNQTVRSAIDITAELKMADVASGPRMLYRSAGGATQEVANGWPFPLVLGHLCYLMREPASGALRLRGWSLHETRLEPGDRARIASAALNDEIDSASTVIAFYDADLVRDDAAVRRTVDELTGGVGALPVHELWVEVVKPAELFEQYGIYKVAVEVSSLHFDPNGELAATHTYQLDAGTPTVQCDPLYLAGAPGADFYAYRVGIVTTDGSVHADTRWRAANTTLPDRIFVGAAVVEEVLGH